VGRKLGLSRLERFLAGLTLVALLVACGPPPHPIDLPSPVEATTLGVGDELEVRIAGEDKLPMTFVVAPDGTVDLPFVNRMKIDGMEPQEVAAAVREKLISGEFYTNPSVSVAIKAYNSKRIEIIGEVKKPGSFPLEPGMTLLRAISLAGGFTSIADKSVTIRRKVKGQVKKATVDVTQIIDNKIDDPPLQSGDTINVDQTIL
jgi:polysaccharide export outer membrane protein